ncbi:MAG: elongation factor G-like protein EF-G2 [Propionibacteriaceae bacterium]|nr:elongation factor G-like protein EF-G2 [Propionibacteriaceae bacterium]
MSPKLSNSQISSPDQARNVVLIGNAGSGKTSLFEQLLKARIQGYRGEKEDPERAAQLFLASFINESVVVNLLDAPSHPDFVGELRAGIAAADAAIFVVSAGDGIDGMAQALWEECENAKLPRFVVLTKLDTGHTDFESALAATQNAFGSGVVPVFVPIMASSEEMSGNVGLLSLERHDYAAGAMKSSTLDASDSLVEGFRDALIEGIVLEVEDDSLMERHIGGEAIEVEVLLDALMKAVSTGNLYPVVPVSAASGVGIEELLGLIENGFPTPSLHASPEIDSLAGDPLPLVTADAAGSLVAQVIRTTTDPFAGRLSMIRIFSGTLKVEDVIHVAGRHPKVEGKESERVDHDSDERIAGMQGVVGVELKPRTSAIAGEIVLIPKLNSAETGDTLSAKDKSAVVKRWILPDPLLPLVVKAATRNDEDKFSGALARLAVEDSTVRVDRSSGDQLVIWTTGQAHADLLLNRLTDRYGVKVQQEELRIPLRETLIGKSTAEGRHVKQSGGHGQYAKCNIEVEPLPRGEGFEFVDKVVGGAVPRQFIPSVEKGVRAQLEKGVIAGYPMVDIRVTLFDGKAHSVDSSDMAFQLAGQNALKEAAKKEVAALLEPIDLVTVTVGEEYLGPVMTDISGRRGQLLGTDSVNRKAVIRALIPQLELARYAIDLRGIAHGSGTFSREFNGYELLPTHMIEQFLKKD